MKVLISGHKYLLDNVDGAKKQTISFVMRIRGSFEGILLQEIIRMLVDRMKFLNAQVPCVESSECILLLRKCLILLEARALRRKLERHEECEYLQANKSDGHVFNVNKDIK